MRLGRLTRRCLASTFVLLLLFCTLSGCGSVAITGAPSPLLAAQNYVAALGDRDFERARALRLPAQFRIVAFNTAYFTDERTRLGMDSLPNPTYDGIAISDDQGAPLSLNTLPLRPSAILTMSVTTGPTLLIVAGQVDNRWFVSDTQRLKLGASKMSFSMYSDRSQIERDLQNAGYDLLGEQHNLIQGSKDEAGLHSEISLDDGGSLRLEITEAGDEQADHPSYGGRNYTVTRSEQRKTNITITLRRAEELDDILNDIETISGGKQPWQWQGGSSAMQQGQSQPQGQTQNQVQLPQRVSGSFTNNQPEANDPPIRLSGSFGHDKNVDDNNGTEGGRVSASDL